MAYDYNSETGAIIPDSATTLSTVQNEFTTSFGADLDLTPSTPQGILITSETLSRDEIARLNADLANQFNPNLAGGIFLDAIMALTGLERIAQSKTTVTATCTGADGTIIYQGAYATTTAGDLFSATSTVTISGGTASVPFASVEYGAIPCAAGTLTTISTGILGWTGVTNSADGILGTLQQSDLSAWSLRRRTLALQGTAIPESIQSNVNNTEGVQSSIMRENIEATEQTIDGIVMKPNSIYLCVNGGTDTAVAEAIMKKRSAGCAFNGTTSVSYTETTGQVIDVLFDRPDVVQILAKLTVRVSAGAGDVTAAIKQRIVDYSLGNIDGEDGFVVGNSVSPFELAAACLGISGVYIVSSQIAPASTGVWQSSEIPIAINEIAAINASGITVVIS